MITTMTDAARRLGIPYQRLQDNIKRGIVSASRAGGCILVNPEIARQELEDNGFFWRSAAIRKGRAAGRAKRNAQIAS